MVRLMARRKALTEIELQQLIELLELRRQATQWTDARIAEQCGCSERTVRRYARRLQRQEQELTEQAAC